MSRFPAGLSWITLGFDATIGEPGGTAECRELIVRIGHPGGLLAPYRAEPEFVVLTALAEERDLPIPRAVAYSDELSLLGAPFLVTDRVRGNTPMPWKGADRDRDDAARLSLGRDFADALGAIHAFDWRSSRLAELFPKIPLEDVALVQLRIWAEHAGVPSASAPPQMHYALRWLEANTPVANRVTIVHGDYRVGNFLEERGRITAILDWELMHLGDPHEDLAWAGLRTFAAGTDRIGGLISREEFHDRWRARTGFTMHDEVIRYYEVLVQFKMAALLIGAVRRIEAGRAHDVRMAAMGFQLAPTLLELNRLIEVAS